MRQKSKPLYSLVLVGVLAAAAGAAAQTMPKEYPEKDWPIYSGSYNSQRFSLLKQVTPANARNLQAKWIFHVANQRDMEAVPIVVNGVMYIGQTNHIDAIDARTGNIIWQYQRKPVSAGAQRGTAVYDNKVFVAAADGLLIALDARNGGELWETKIDGNMRMSGSAPLIANGKVIVTGNTPSGFVQAFDVETGKHVWTWTAMPKAGEPGFETWGGATPSGAPMWVSGSFDPKLNLIYYGTGQPNPEWQGVDRPGDNLYSDSIVALDVDTGKLKWYFQTTPHDVHDWDTLEMPVLIDANFKGQQRKLVVQANRNGFYYILDRTNGQFLQGTPFVSKVDWASGFDPKGRPILVPGHDPTVAGTTTCPATAGATNWPSPTYDPQTHYFYVVSQEGCGINVLSTEAPGQSGTNYIESPADQQHWQLYVRAIDALTGKKVWDYEEIGSHHYGPGLLSTAGGMIFAAEQFGQFSALDARSGKPLWHFNTGDEITASPITYSVDGKQYVAVVGSTNVFSFALPDPAPKKGATP